MLKDDGWSGLCGSICVFFHTCCPYWNVMLNGWHLACALALKNLVDGTGRLLIPRSNFFSISCRENLRIK